MKLFFGSHHQIEQMQHFLQLAGDRPGLNETRFAIPERGEPHSTGR